MLPVGRKRLLRVARSNSLTPHTSDGLPFVFITGEYGAAEPQSSKWHRGLLKQMASSKDLNSKRAKEALRRTATMKLKILFITGLVLLILNSEQYHQSFALETGKEITSTEIYVSNTSVVLGGFLVFFLKELNWKDPGQNIIIKSELFTSPQFYPYNGGAFALVGIDYRTLPGEYKVITQFRNEETLVESLKIIRVLPRIFPTSQITVSPERLVLRSSEAWEEDRPQINEIKAASSGKPLWIGKFLLPLSGEIKNNFGLIRFINQESAGQHSGIDICAPEGTPVKAANSGIIRLARFLKVTGNTIIIDHGCNLFSSYSHLSSLLVKEQDYVYKGQVIGEVGSTGFSTGPHLHWATTIGSTFIDPWLLIQEDPLQAMEIPG